MGNGANKLFNIMNKTGNQNNSTSLVTLTVKSTNPLIFKLDEKLSITEEFYILDNPEGTFEVNDAVNALVLNNNQLYYILNGLDLAEVAFSGDYNDLTNKPEIPTWEVIDDMTTQEDQHTNAPSIDAVKQYVTTNIINCINKQVEQGTILAGATVYSDYISGFFGFVVIHVFANNFEYFYTGALSGSNKYAYKLEKLLEYKYQGDANADCEIDTYNSPDTPNFHIKINNTGSIALNYEMSLTKMI